jgi:hypothetical protein
MKHLLYACCFLFTGMVNQALNAQETTPSPLTVGFDVGFVFNHNTDSITTAVNAHTIQVRSSYRFTRWLGASASLGYGNVSETGDFFLTSFGVDRVGVPWTSVRKTHRIPVAIGPEINLRIGQGDLSIAAQFGFIYNQSKTVLSNPSENYVLPYRGTLDTYNNLAFSYTYWPQKRFGVRIGVQFQDWRSATYSPTELDASSQQQYPDLQESIINRSKPNTNALELELFQIGLTYRL